MWGASAAAVCADASAKPAMVLARAREWDASEAHARRFVRLETEIYARRNARGGKG
jgi:hypothetical protein